MKPEWIIMDVKRGDQRAVARVRLDEPTDTPKEAAKSLVTVNWEYAGLPDGLPTRPENDGMGGFEELLDDLSGENGNSTLMLVVTGSRQRQWAYYVVDVDVFMAAFNEALAGTERLPIRIGTEFDPAWAYWQGFASRAVRH
jgi:hypothetical protein